MLVWPSFMLVCARSAICLCLLIWLSFMLSCACLYLFHAHSYLFCAHLCLFAFIWDGGWWWWWWCVLLDVSLEVAAVVGIVITNMSRGRGVWGQKPKSECKSFDLGCIYVNAAKMGCCINTSTHCEVT